MENKPAAQDWHETQNEAYLDLLQRRLSEPRLIWVNQFIGIINKEISHGAFDELESVSPNDYGCNVGHFFRGVEDIGCTVRYRGFDISETYLSIARNRFGPQHWHLLDVTALSVRAELLDSDISVVSATLEHLEHCDRAMQNIFSHTKKLVILRTFVGEASRQDRCIAIGAKSDYLIRQFTINDLTNVPSRLGWSYTQETDLATQGKVKMVCNASSIPRMQTVIVFRKQ